LFICDQEKQRSHLEIFKDFTSHPDEDISFFAQSMCKYLNYESDNKTK